MFKMHARFHGGQWKDSPFQKGDMKYVILDLIKDKPRYGYEIIRILEERSHGCYAPSPGAVYPTLQYLEEVGYITADQQNGKKIYTITDDGLRFLEDQSDFAEGIKKHMRDWWGSKNPDEMREIVAELGRLAKLVGRRFRSINAEQIKRIHEVVSRASDDIENILEE